jgi:ATP-dependent helicase/nuclease subunit B
VVPDPAEAPTERQLARALALGRDVDPDESELPGPIVAEPVLAALGERDGVSAGSLERWLECPHRWFVEHELKPARLEEDTDPLWLGGVVHAALERLYSEAPGADAIPRPGDVGRWKERLGELLDDEAGEDPLGPERRTGLARARAQVEAFLETEASSEVPFRPLPNLLEWRFGMDEDGTPSAELGGFELHGIVDRIDVLADGRTAIVRDYKTSKDVPGAGAFADKGKLQLPLYMLAARRLLDLDVVGGLYQPLGAYGDRRPRGLVVRDERTEGLDLLWKSRDVCDADGFEEQLEAALARARDAASEMREGAIGRRPLGDRCPKYCTYQAICRIERGLGDPADESETED